MNSKQWIFTILILCVAVSTLYFETPMYKSKKIAALLQEYSLTYDIDAKSINNNFTIKHELSELTTCEALMNKIGNFVHHKKPIVLTMVGFPYKSSNTKDKVLSSMADGAERYSLVYIHTLLEKIKKIYEPGAKLFIFTDGIAFCDIEHITDEAVTEYENSLKTLAQDLPYITILTMRDICPHQSPEEVRNLISHMNPSLENFHEMLGKDQKLQEDVAVLTQRLAFELALLLLTQQDIAKIGLQETHRSLQYSSFLKPFRPEETITCSVHYQKNPNRKIGLKLSDSCVTAWHGVLVETDGNFTIEHLKDVNKDHYRTALNIVNGLEIAHLQKLHDNNRITIKDKHP